MNGHVTGRWIGAGVVVILLAACGSAPATVGPSTPPAATVAPTIAAPNQTASGSQLVPTVPPATATATATAPPNAPGSAGNGGAGSLAYISGYNVWIAAPDGSGARQLTTDGSSADPYHDPSQSNDGRIFALRGTKTLVQLDHGGYALAPEIDLDALENGAEGLAVAPDSTRIAYVTTGFGQTIDPRFGTPNGGFIYGGTDVAGLDGTSVVGDAVPNLIFPSWLDASHLVGTDGVDLYVNSIGTPDVKWLSLIDGCLLETLCDPGQEAAANLNRPVASADGRVVAYEYVPFFGQPGRRMASVNATLSAAPLTRCVIAGQQNDADAGSFAPNGSEFAFDDTQFNPDTLDQTAGQGIFAMQVDLGAPDCGASSAKLVLPGGSQPDWGNAAP